MSVGSIILLVAILAFAILTASNGPTNNGNGAY